MANDDAHAPQLRGAWGQANWTVVLGFLFPALGGLLFGYDIGATSGAVSADQVLRDMHVQSDAMVGVLTSVSLYGALLASGALFFLGDRIGRKREMLAAAALYTAGSAASALAPLQPAVGISCLCFGRFVYGLGIGCAMHSVPVYISEMAPPSIRGLLIAGKEAFVVLGMLAGYCMAALFIAQAGGWRWMYAGGAAIAGVFGAGVLLILPDSPRWLLLRSLSSPHRYPRHEARNALKWFRRSATSLDLDAELAEILDTLAGQEVGTLRELCKCKRALLVGNGLLLLQQISGQPSVLYYAVTVFKSAGFGKSSSTLASVGVAAVKLLATVLASLKVDDFGRRLLLMVGIGGMAVALGVIGLAFRFGYTSDTISNQSSGSGSLSEVWGQVTVVGMLLLVTSYQVGFGPISWLMISEIFPLRVRGMALAVGSIVNFGTNILVAVALPVMFSAFGQAAVFWMFGGIAAASLLFVVFVVPETKGKTLEEIEALLGEKNPEPSLRDPLVDSLIDGIGA